MMKSQRGFTLLELMIALILVATLTVASYASYSQFAERARVAKAIGEIGQVHIAVQRYLLEINAGFPANLAEVGLGNLVDP